MSMDEAQTTKDTITGSRGSDPPGPLHEIPYRTSRMEVKTRGDKHIRHDPETAHKAAGDNHYSLRLPESCYLCKAQELAAKEAKEALDAQ